MAVIDPPSPRLCPNSRFARIAPPCVDAAGLPGLDFAADRALVRNQFSSCCTTHLRRFTYRFFGIERGRAACRSRALRAGWRVHPLLLSIIASAGLGAVIGLIRQWSDQTDKPGSEAFAGVRTFTFWSVLGCVSAFVSEEYSPAILPVTLAIIGGHFLWRTSAQSAVRPAGSTTLAATLLTLLVGALVFYGHAKEAVLVSAITVVLLGVKTRVHAWTREFTDEDIRATLQFVAITGVILPLVPNESIGPLRAINPYNVWMMVVLISGLGFFGYVMTRLLDARTGLMVTSFFGGLASSTATTLALAKQSCADEKASRHYALGIVVACTVMLPRTIVLVAAINRPLALGLVLPLALMAAPALGYAGWIGWRHRRERTTKPAETAGNPLQLGTAIKFALLYAAIVFLVRVAAENEVLERSLLPLSFVSGLTDMAAISLSMARSATEGGEVDLTLATQAIVLAAVANTLVKTIIAVASGTPTLRVPVALVLGATCLAGGFAFWTAGR
ncbi:MAG: hypothetical protein C0518_14990 [Opitutus sp.]|nr:hypothetical protein [Opitutus sp.]